MLDPAQGDDRVILDAIATMLAPLDGVRVPLWVFSEHRLQLVWANRAGLRLWESPSLTDLRSRDLALDLTDAMHCALKVSLARISAGEAVVELSTIYPRGIAKRIRMVHHHLRLPDGTDAMLSEAEVEPPAEHLVQFASELSLLLAVFTPDGERVSMNAAFRQQLSDVVTTLSHLVADATPVEALVASLAPVEPRGYDLELLTVRGRRIFRVELRRVAGEGDAPRVLASLYDVTASRRERAELLRLAHTDTLTGVANRHGVLLEAERRAAGERPYDVLYIDLDGLKQVNDALGHRVGDLALAAAARRIEAGVAPDGFAGRMGGDEFVAFVPSEGGTPSAGERVAEELRERLSVPYELDALRVILTASIGVAPHDPAATDGLEGKLRRADAAMFEAKRAGKNRVHRAHGDALASEQRVRRLHELLPQALARGELRVVVQPIVEMRDASVARGECLLRWNSAELGNVPPAEFVAVAEQSGLVRELCRFVLARACDLLREMGATGRPIPLAVNLSPREVVLPTLADDVRAELERTGVEPSLLTVELTEGAMIGRMDLAQAQLARVRALGVRVALDDFGTGYSALSIIHQLDVDTLKVDRSLVKDLPQERPLAVARAILRLAESLGITVVAEGVETWAQADALRAMGCAYGQGYLWAKPMEIASFKERAAGA